MWISLVGKLALGRTKNSSLLLKSYQMCDIIYFLKKQLKKPRLEHVWECHYMKGVISRHTNALEDIQKCIEKWSLNA